jgi:hypothetical protein
MSGLSTCCFLHVLHLAATVGLPGPGHSAGVRCSEAKLSARTQAAVDKVLEGSFGGQLSYDTIKTAATASRSQRRTMTAAS